MALHGTQRPGNNATHFLSASSHRYFLLRHRGDSMSLDLFRLDGSVAIVTGSSKGIGAAVAKGLAAVGAHVVVCSRHGSEAANVLAQIESETGREGLALAVDVSRRAGSRSHSAGFAPATRPLWHP